MRYLAFCSALPILVGEAIIVGVSRANLPYVPLGNLGLGLEEVLLYALVFVVGATLLLFYPEYFNPFDTVRLTDHSLLLLNDRGGSNELAFDRLVSLVVYKSGSSTSKIKLTSNTNERFVIVSFFEMDRMVSELEKRLEIKTIVKVKKEWFPITYSSTALALIFVVFPLIWVFFRLVMHYTSLIIDSARPEFVGAAISAFLVLDGIYSLRGRPLIGGLYKILSKYGQGRKTLKLYNWLEIGMGILLLLFITGTAII